MPVPLIESFLVPFHVVAAVFFILILGAFYRRKGWFPQTADGPLYSVTVNLLMPSLILDNIIRNEDLFSQASNLYLPPLAGFSMTVIGIACGLLIALLPKKWTGLNTWKSAGTFAACVGVLNYGFTPIPLTEHLFNDKQTTGILFVQNLGTELSIWTIVVMVMSGRINKSIVKRAVNPPTCAIVLGILLNVTGLGMYVPEFLVKTIHILGGASIPITIFLIGLVIADLLDWKTFQNRWKRIAKIAVWSCLVRLVLLPAIFLFILMYIDCSLEMKRVVVIHSAMSSAIFPIVLSQHYGGDESVAMDVILSNNFLGLITSPIWVAIGLWLIGV